MNLANLLVIYYNWLKSQLMYCIMKTKKKKVIKTIKKNKKRVIITKTFSSSIFFSNHLKKHFCLI